MNWISENYRWLFDGFGGAVIISIVGYIAHQLLKRGQHSQKQESKSSTKIQDSSVINSSIQTTQVPIQINQARDINVGVPIQLPRTREVDVANPTVPDIRYIGARTACLDGPLDGLYEKTDSPEKNAVIILFANEPNQETQTADVYVKATLIYYDGEDELCDITGSWVGGDGDMEPFDADGKRHKLIAGVQGRDGFAAIETLRSQEMSGTAYPRENHWIQIPTLTLHVRLVNVNKGVTLYEGRFVLTADPLTITPTMEPIV